MNKDVREALSNLEHAIDHTEDTSADTAEMNIYGALWTDMANAAARCAADLEHKKVAPGAANTESEKENSYKFSVDENLPDVKTGETYVLSRYIGNNKGHFECAGNTMELAVCGAAVISGLARQLPRNFVVAAILSGCDHAGISVDELVATHEGAHIR